MSEPRRWYASQRASITDGPRGCGRSRAMLDEFGGLWLYPRGNGAPVWSDVVTGRSAAHVDRLARDWIAHGVSPTKAGGRGVTRPDCSCPNQAWWVGYPDSALPSPRVRPGIPGHLRACGMERYLRAEARALRVVAR